MRPIDADALKEFIDDCGICAICPQKAPRCSYDCDFPDCVTEKWNVAIDAQPTIDAVSEWIPCSERLPKIGEYHISEPCIVYCKGGVYAFAELEENIFGQVGWNCERDDDYHEPIGEVVAWMPLPPKPYGERKGE